jgi:arabinofuranosyltransferase
MGVLTGALVLYGLLVAIFLPYGIDDSFISLAYARNLAGGRGLVFQEGAAPVEGYSNFLWVVLLAPLARLDVDLYLASKALSAALGGLCIIILWRLADRWNESRSWWSALPVWLMAVSPIHSFWSAVGMEAPLVTLLVMVFVLRMARERDGSFPWSSGIALLLALARPEGVLYVLLGLLYRVGTGRRDHFRWLAPFVLLYGAYTVFRYQYFGQLLPAPYYAKTGAVGSAKISELYRGTLYVLRFVREQCNPALLTLAVLAVVPARGRSVAALLWIVIGGQALFAVAVGGDWMPNHRFMAPVLPLLFLLQQRGLMRLGAAVRRFPEIRAAARWPLAGLLLAVLYLPCVLLQTPGWSVSPQYMAVQARAAGYRALVYPRSWVDTAMGSLEPFRQIVRYLDDAGAQGATVAMQIVGYFGYEAQGRYRVLDTAGITNMDVARLIHDRVPLQNQAGFVLAREPRYVWLTARSPSLEPFRAQYEIDGAIVQDSSFKAAYRHLKTFGGRGHYQMLFGRVTSPHKRGDTSQSAPG